MESIMREEVDSEGTEDLSRKVSGNVSRENRTYYEE